MLPVLEHVVVIVSNMDDLNAAPSGYEYEQIHTSFCPDGLPLDFALLTLLAAFGVAFGVLYVALTMASGGRRSDSSSSEQSLLAMLGSNLADLLWSGINVWQTILSPILTFPEDLLCFMQTGDKDNSAILAHSERFFR